MVSEVICYRGKSALREVGKVFGLSSIRSIGWPATHHASGTRRELRATRRLQGDGPRSRGRAPAAERELARAIEGFPRHLSIHVGGFVLSAAAARRGRAHRAGAHARAHGDAVGQGRHRDARLLQGRRARARHAHRDPQVPGADLRRTARFGSAARAPAFDPIDSAGASPAGGLRRLRHVLSSRHGGRVPDREPRADGDAAAAQAATLLRSRGRGRASFVPARSRAEWCIRIYAGEHGEEPVASPHPCLEPILERTLGVPLFQEQVMQIAIVGAGYTRGRGRPAAPGHGRVEEDTVGSMHHRDALLRGFAARGISAEFGERLFEQIQGLRRVRLPRVPRCVVCAARLRVGLAQGVLSRRTLPARW